MNQSIAFVKFSHISIIFFLILNLSCPSNCFQSLNLKSSETKGDNNQRCTPTMKWSLSKGTAALGGIGNQGEYYYIPSKKSVLKAPENVLGKERIIPLFPRNQVLGPLGENNFSMINRYMHMYKCI